MITNIIVPKNTKVWPLHRKGSNTLWCTKPVHLNRDVNITVVFPVDETPSLAKKLSRFVELNLHRANGASQYMCCLFDKHVPIGQTGEVVLGFVAKVSP